MKIDSSMEEDKGFRKRNKQHGTTKRGSLGERKKNDDGVAYCTDRGEWTELHWFEQRIALFEVCCTDLHYVAPFAPLAACVIFLI